MAKSDYMPNDDEGKAQLFLLFRDQIGRHLAVLGIAADDPEIVQQAADAARFRAVVSYATSLQATAKAWTALKDSERDGNGTQPSDITITVPGADFPPPVPPGIVGRFRRLVKRIKLLRGYNESIGTGLGVEGRQRIAPDLNEVAPQLGAKRVAERVEIEWEWQGLRQWLDMIELQVDRGDGKGFVFLTQDTTPGYIDTEPLPAAATTWKYRGIYRAGDHRVGRWGEVKINVGG